MDYELWIIYDYSFYIFCYNSKMKFKKFGCSKKLFFIFTASCRRLPPLCVCCVCCLLSVVCVRFPDLPLICYAFWFPGPRSPILYPRASLILRMCTIIKKNEAK